MPPIRFRLPGREQVLGTWLAQLFPQHDRASRRRWIEDSAVRIDGRIVDRAGFVCPAGARVEIAAELDPDTALGPESEHAAWLAIIDDPPWFGGRLSGASEASGALRTEFDVSLLAREGGLARLRLDGTACSARPVLAALAAIGWPVVGDLTGGGLGLPGGAQLVGWSGAGEAIPSLRFPDEVVWRPAADAATAAGTAGAVDCADGAGGAADERRAEAVVLVSREAARAIRKGHPWLLPDEASDPVARFRPGSLIRVSERGASTLGWARAEGDPELAARMWAVGDVALREVDSVEARIARALARRRALLTPLPSKSESNSDAFRLVHGEGDALPGFFVDRLGPLLRVLISGRASEGFRERALAALTTQWPVTPEGNPWCMLEVQHLRSGRADRRRGLERVRWIDGDPERLAEVGARVDASGFWVEERGLSFRVEPGWDEPARTRPGYGLFLDQRENRDRLAPFAARGGRWLNLFAHTGAFSVALLAAGAGQVTSVDLSAPYLARLEANLAANRDRGVAEDRHVTVRSDGRRFLEGLTPGDRFDGIVLDPPTAAAAGRRFWSLQRDLEPLLRLCLAHLTPGGVLLVTQNRAGPPLGLDRLLERSASRAHREVDALAPAPAGLDHPSLAGFPEGDPFEGWLLELQ